MASSRVDFANPLVSPVEGTGWQMEVTAAVPKGAGWVCAVIVTNGTDVFPHDRVEVTNFRERQAWLELVDDKLGLLLTSDDEWAPWRAAAELIAANIDAHVAEYRVKRDESRRNIADRLVDYGQQGATELFVDQLGAPHALVDGRPFRLSVSAGAARRWLRQELWIRERRSAPGEALQSALGTLAAIAETSGTIHPLAVRSQQIGDELWVELSPARAVHITASGWEIENLETAMFRQFANAQALPDPVGGGSLDGWLQLIPTTDERLRRLLRAYVEVAWFAGVARPVLIPTGTGGSGKSTLVRLVKRLLDPGAPESVRLDQRDVLQKASHCAVLVLDNVTGLPEWGVDVVCRLVTGEADSKRALYSDDDDVIVELQRLVLISGVNSPSDRADFVDRILPVLLERLGKPRPEAALWADFANGLTGWLGAVCDAAVGILKHLPTLELAEEFRLADWARLAAASYLHHGLTVQQFVTDWRVTVQQQQAGVIEGSSLGQCVLALMHGRNEWSGRSSELHKLLEEQAEAVHIDTRRDRSWPRTPTWLWRRLVEIQHVLLARGIAAVRAETKDANVITLLCLPADPARGPEVGEPATTATTAAAASSNSGGSRFSGDYSAGTATTANPSQNGSGGSSGSNTPYSSPPAWGDVEQPAHGVDDDELVEVGEDLGL